MTDTRESFEAALTRSLRERAKSATQSTELALKAQRLAAFRRHRSRLATVSVIAVIGATAVGVSAIRGGSAPSTGGQVATQGAGAPSCGRSLNEVVASEEQLRLLAGRVTVCRWTNPSSGDPVVDQFKLESERHLTKAASTTILAELRKAPIEPPTCFLADSPPAVLDEVLVRDDEGSTLSVRVPKESCLGIYLSGDKTASAYGVGDALKSID